MEESYPPSSLTSSPGTEDRTNETQLDAATRETGVGG